MQEPAFSFFTVDPRDKASRQAVCKHLRPLLIRQQPSTPFSALTGVHYLDAPLFLQRGF